MNTVALMFHDVVSSGCEDGSGFPGRDAARYKLTPERFAAHLDAMITSCGSAEAARSIVVTFDDGGVGALRAAELLEQHGLRGQFFVTTDYVGRRGFLEGRDLRDLHARGHVIGSHSRSHPLRMAHCSDRQLREEWIGSRSELAGILGDDVPTASVPGGDYTPRVAAAAGAAGFVTLFTSEPTRTVVRVGTVEVRGRFVVRRGTRPQTVAAVTAGSRGPVRRQRIWWNLRKGMKRAAGSTYLGARRLLLRHGREVSWGDTEP